MEKIIVASEDDLKTILREIISEWFQSGKRPEITTDVKDDELVTNLKQIAKLFRCSLPTAQKIKNSVPIRFKFFFAIILEISTFDTMPPETIWIIFVNREVCSLACLLPSPGENIGTGFKKRVDY